MDIPEPEYGDDLVEWSFCFIDTTMNFGPIPEVKKIEEIGKNLCQIILTLFLINALGQAQMCLRNTLSNLLILT